MISNARLAIWDIDSRERDDLKAKKLLLMIYKTLQLHDEKYQIMIASSLVNQNMKRW